MKQLLKVLTTATAVTLLTFAIGLADVPNLIHYQGRLADTLGNPVADGSYMLRFIIYDQPAGGNSLWISGFQSVNTTDGIFSIELGASPMPALPENLFADSMRYLGIALSGESEMTPRVRLVSTPYSRQAQAADSAGLADMVDGLHGSDLALATHNHDASYADVTHLHSDYVDLTSAQTITGSKTFSGSTTYFSDSTMSVDHNGVRIGNAGSPLLSFLIYSSRTYNTTTNRTGYESRLYNESSGSLTGGSFIVGATAASDGGGDRYGVTANVQAELSSASTLYALRGVAGSSNRTAGISYGVFAQGLAGSGGTAYGIFAQASGDGNNYAGYFAGDVHVTGTLSKAAGSFKIDHPLDPENKYLQHSFVESPDMMNVYNGNVVTDHNGEATVTLPKYFEALNMEFRYQLTAIGAPGPNLYVAEEIDKNQFKIAGAEPGAKVSWQVTGIRQDPYAKNNRLQVETDKPLNERGTYLSPTAYGMPIERHVDYRHAASGFTHSGP